MILGMTNASKHGEGKLRVALTGDVALELVAPYFNAAGYETYVPSGFGAWRTELLDSNSALNKFNPDFIYNVTERNEVLAAEVDGFYDERMRKLAAMPYSITGIAAIVEEFEFWRCRGLKKVLAVDADNTLWSGIFSEDGAENLKPFTEFQSGLKSLADDGVVIIVLSKNDPENANHGPFELGFAALQKINWAPKAGNLIEACQALNLSTDSVVFVDDNPHERAQMKAHLPEVTVVPFPSDMTRPAQLLRRLREYFFAEAGTTPEDRMRIADYRSGAAHDELKRRYAGVDDYLSDLGLTVVPSRATENDLDRLAQMAGKTNQFNATTIRRTREEFSQLLEDPGNRVFVFRAADRFGEQGIVCYVVVDVESRRITDFVMSCRAMGRTLEFFAYRYVIDAIGFAPAIDFSATAKNGPFAEFISHLNAGECKTFYKEAR